MLECSSTLLYPVSLLRLGTGWEPPIRGSEMFERFPRPNLTDFFHFFCKKHMAYPFPNITFFFGRAQKNFPARNWVCHVLFAKKMNIFNNVASAAAQTFYCRV